MLITQESAHDLYLHLFQEMLSNHISALFLRIFASSFHPLFLLWLCGGILLDKRNGKQDSIHYVNYEYKYYLAFVITPMLFYNIGHYAASSGEMPKSKKYSLDTFYLLSKIDFMNCIMISLYRIILIYITFGIYHQHWL